MKRSTKILMCAAVFAMIAAVVMGADVNLAEAVKELCILPPVKVSF